MLSRKLLTSLQDFTNNGKLPVISLYLNVNGAGNAARKKYEAELKSMLREVERTAGDMQMSREQRGAMADELAAIGDFVNADFRREGARGLTLISCRPEKLWQEIRLGVPVPNKLFVDWQPRIAPLAEICDAHRYTCILVTDKQTSRIFHAFAGEIEELTGIFDQVPGHHEQGGWEQSKLQRWHDLEVREHLKKAADAAMDLFKRDKFQAVVIGITDELWPELEQVMHPYLRERVSGRFNIDINASAAEVLEKAARIEADARKSDLVSLLDSLGPELAEGKNFVGGLDDVLAVLNQRRVDILIIEEGFTKPGQRCFSCDSLTWSERTCPSCGTDSAFSADIVEDAREAAVRQAATVTTVPQGSDAMRVAEGIAARLRY